MKTRLMTIVFALVCLASAGCDIGDVGCVTGSTIATVCSTDASLNAALSRPGTSPAAVSLESTGGGCDGPCTNGYWNVNVASSGGGLVCLFSASNLNDTAPLTAQTVNLPDAPLFISCNTDDDTTSFFSPVSGTFTIDGVDGTSLHATFSMDLTRGSDGATVRFSNGSFAIGGCHDAEVCTF